MGVDRRHRELTPTCLIIKGNSPVELQSDALHGQHEGDRQAQFQHAAGPADGGAAQQAPGDGVVDADDSGLGRHWNPPAHTALERTLKGDEKLALPGGDSRRLDAHHERAILQPDLAQWVRGVHGLGRVKIFHRPRVGDKPLPAQRHLAAMLEDGLTLRGLLIGREPQRPAGRGQVLLALVHEVMDHARRDRGGDPAQGQAHEHGEGIMIGMYVMRRWGNQQRGPARFQALNQCRKKRGPGVHERGSRALIRQPQEMGTAPGKPEDTQCRQRFLPPARAPTLSLILANAPAPLHKPLRPRIIVAIAHEENLHLRTFLDRPLNQPARRQRFVVGMRGDDQDTLLGEGKVGNQK